MESAKDIGGRKNGCVSCLKIKRGKAELAFPSPLVGEGRRERSERGVRGEGLTISGTRASHPRMAGGTPAIRGGQDARVPWFLTPHPALAALVSALSHKGRGNTQVRLCTRSKGF